MPYYKDGDLEIDQRRAAAEKSAQRKLDAINYAEAQKQINLARKLAISIIALAIALAYWMGWF